MTIRRIHPKLINHFKCVFAPVGDIHQTVYQRRTVFTLKAALLPQMSSRIEHIRRNHLL